ncbi:MAG: hypothetical protein H0V29_11750 [Thermoleophilaceae bacterium]|nr:hypothetical protein [Thermoleophilaceae bacterium]
MPKTRLVPATFLLLVAATLGAFFLTQRLKREQPLVERVFFPRYLSPNGDGRKDSVRMRFDLPKAATVTVAVVNDDDEAVRTLAEDARLGKGTHSYVWDGGADGGARAPDGTYRLRVNVRSEGRALTASRELVLDTKAPAPDLVAVGPRTILPGLPGKRGRARIRFEGPSNPAPRFRVYRTDAAGAAKEVASFAGPRFRQIAFWDGLVAGRPAPAGTYAITVSVQDRAGNEGSAPPRLPPRRGETKPTTGVSVRYLTVRAPLEPVRAGAVARFAVGPVNRRFRWSLYRLAGSRPVARGEGSGREGAVRIPSNARAGIYILRLLASGRRVAAPIVVPGNGTERVLVVAPAITWQGTNPADGDGDGFADTLDNSREVALARPFVFGGLPGGFARGVGPLMRFLDREGFDYDMTTDLALARRRGPRIAGRAGIVFPGSERWLPDRTNLTLRRFVEEGGTVASFGTDAFRRTVTVGPEELFNPSRPDVLNVFGEQTGAFSTEPAPLDVSLDRLRLFANTDGIVGEFEDFERSLRLAPGNVPRTKAGREDRTAFVAYKRGEGLVIRVGTPQWSARISSLRDVAEVTRRIWTLSSR